MKWTAADVDKAALPRNKPRVQRKAPAPPKEPPKQPGALRSGETALPEIPALPKPDTGTPGGPCIWYFNRGLTSFSLAGDHFGERHRLVLTLPKDPALLRALLATAETYYATLKT